MMDYTNGGSWRVAGALPSPRYGLKAASIDGQLYVSKFKMLCLPKQISKCLVELIMLLIAINEALQQGVGWERGKYRGHGRDSLMGANLRDLEQG